MVMKQHKNRKHRRWNRLRKPQGDAEMTTHHSEQEILSLARDQSSGAGIIRPDTGDLHMPSGFTEPGYGHGTNSPPRVMLVIITLALVFIAIITYFVTQMPPKN